MYNLLVKKSLDSQKKTITNNCGINNIDELLPNVYYNNKPLNSRMFRGVLMGKSRKIHCSKTLQLQKFVREITIFNAMNSVRE